MTPGRRTVRVPLNVDAQFRLPVGPAVLPLRSLILVAAVSPAAYLLLALRLPGFWGVVGAGFLLALASSLGLPERQGVWIGTHLAYRHAWRVMPSLISRDGAVYALVRQVGGSIHVGRRRPVPRRRLTPRRLRPFTTVPTTSTASAGVLSLVPGGHRGIVALDGPAVSVASDGHLEWCRSVTSWIGALDCPVQFLTVMTHHDADRVGDAFDRRVRGWPPTPLRDIERRLVETLAETTLGLLHYVVLAPGSAHLDGMPHRCTPWRQRPPRMPRLSRPSDWCDPLCASRRSSPSPRERPTATTSPPCWRTRRWARARRWWAAMFSTSPGGTTSS